MNHSETAFLRRQAYNEDAYLIRWFTPFAEEFLCGHGLLAAAIALHLTYGGSSFMFVTSKGTPLSATLADSNNSTALSSSPNPFTSNAIAFNLTFPLSPPLSSLNPPYRHIDLYASALSIPASAILSLSRDALNDVIIELREDLDFSAEGLEVDAPKLVEASPEGTRSQVLTSRCVGWGGNLGGEFSFAKRVFAYGSEGALSPFTSVERTR
jgi:predicted PhzF superfamily epimerase YddE/YHI9